MSARGGFTSLPSPSYFVASLAFTIVVRTDPHFQLFSAIIPGGIDVLFSKERATCGDGKGKYDLHREERATWL